MLVAKSLRFIKKHIAIVLFSVLYLLISFVTYKDYGVTYDEKVEYDAGKYLLQYIRTPTNAEYVSRLTNDSPSSIKQRHLPLFSTYSRLYPMLVNLANPKGYFEWYHLQNLIFGLSLFIGSYMYLYMILGQGKKAIVAPILLFLTPTISGHIPANPKDIPFAIVVIFGILAISYYNSRNTLEKHTGYFELIVLGLIFGLAQGLRTVGITLFITYVITGIAFLAAHKSRPKLYRGFLTKSAVILLISLFVWILSVPYMGANFIANLSYIINSSSGFKDWDNLVLYNGNFYFKSERPWHYLFLYTLIQLPILISVGFLSGLYLVITKKLKQTIYGPIGIGLVFLGLNILIYILIHPVVYNTTRHFIYLLAILVMISSYFLLEIFQRLRGTAKKVLFVVSGTYMIFTFVRILNLYPYQYVYYNEIVGGSTGAWHRFEQDYWGAAYKESTEIVVETIIRNDLQNVKLYACDNQFAVVYYSQFRFQLVERSKDADIVICDTFKEHMGSVMGGYRYDDTHPVVKTIEREGVALNNIRATEPYLKYFK